MGRTQRNQWLAEFESGAGNLENPLFLADVTMPCEAIGTSHSHQTWVVSWDERCDIQFLAALICMRYIEYVDVVRR